MCLLLALQFGTYQDAQTESIIELLLSSRGELHNLETFKELAGYTWRVCSLACARQDPLGHMAYTCKSA